MDHITAVVPAYNTARFIEESLHSIFSQTYQDFDVVVVDDHSDDGTAEIVEKYLCDYPVSLLSLSEHAGVTNATHEGILAARGPLITIVDSDDRVLPPSFSTGVRPFQNPAVGFVWTMFNTSFNRCGWSRPLPPRKTLYNALMTGWWRAAHQKFFRKSFYMQSLQLNTSIDRASDFQLVLLLALTGCKSVHVPVVTYWYRERRPGSITCQGPKLQSQAVEKIKQWVKGQVHLRGIHEPI